MAFISTSPSAARTVLTAVRRAMGPRIKEKHRSEFASGLETMTLSDIRQQFTISVPEKSANSEENARLHRAAHALVRQDNWETLGQLIREHDQERRTTTSGKATADVLSAGARQDLMTPSPWVCCRPTKTDWPARRMASKCWIRF